MAAGDPAPPSWMPDRKVLASGISGVAAFAILTAARHYGYDLQPMADAIFPPPGTVSVIAVLTGGITTLMAYLVPPSDKDIVKRLDDRIVKLAQEDPKSPVSLAPVVVVPPGQQPPLVITPDKKS